MSQAFVLGLSMGPLCLGYCAPVCFPLVGCGKYASLTGAGRVLGVFLLGRLVGYSLVALLTGWAGSTLLRNLSDLVWGVLRMAMGILVIAFGFLSANRNQTECPNAGAGGDPSAFAISLGLLTGLNLCPPFGAAIIAAASTASIPNSLAYFWAFFAGTAVYFVPLLLLGPFTKMEPFRHVARVCTFLAGTWLTLQGGVLVLTRIWIRGH